MPNFSVPNQINPGDTSDATKAMANWNQVVNDLNAAKIDNTNIAASAGILADQLADAARLGVSGVSTVRRGAVSTATSESTSSTTYTTLTTPDKVTSVVLPTNGLIVVAYRATWQESVNGAASAAIFVGVNQLKTSAQPSPVVEQATVGSPTNANRDVPLFTTVASEGLASGASNQAAYTGDATTGEVVQPIHIFAAAGTYDISVQFKASSGSVTAKNRKLWVWTVGF